MFSCFDRAMAEANILIQTPDELVGELAWGLLDSVWLLPDAPRKGRVPA